MMQIKKTMFREYDVRGRVNKEELNEDSCQLIGKGFGTFLRKHKIKSCLVGYDAREYSIRLKNALVKGLISCGLNVTEIGMVLAPILYFAQYYLKSKSGAMVTASHNPNGWSGFKLTHDFATTLLPDDIKKLYQIITKGKFEKGQGKVEYYERIIENYKNYILAKVHLKRKLKVVVDCGNGTAGIVVPDILRRAGCKVIEQFCNIDFSFPHHEPNPTLVEVLEMLAKKVKEVKADIGLGYDGDGDRLGVVNEKGEIVWPDRVVMLLSRLVLKKNPGAKIIYDVKSTRGLKEDIEAHGGIPIIWKSGHSYIKQKMKEEDAALAGEFSGHIYFRDDYYGFDDAVFSSLKLLEYLSSEEKTFSEILASTPQYFSSPTWHVDCVDEVKYKVVKKLTKEFKEEYGEEKVIDINGARVEFEDGWALVRASSNLPVLTLGFEAKTKKRLKELEKVFRKKLKKYPEIGKKWRSG